MLQGKSGYFGIKIPGYGLQGDNMQLCIKDEVLTVAHGCKLMTFEFISSEEDAWLLTSRHALMSLHSR